MTTRPATLDTTSTVRSADGTRIAFSRTGHGPPLILIDGALCHRGFGPNRKLATRLQRDFTIVTYDRRGRGDSGDSAGYADAVEREVEDVAALAAAVGGSAHLYGISSGGALALEAARSLPDMVEGLAVYEIPFVVDGGRPPARPDLTAEVAQLVANGRRGAAVKLFMREAVRLPGFLVGAMPFLPGWRANKGLAHTLAYDLSVMGDGQSGRPLGDDPRRDWGSITAPTLVANGGRSPDWIRSAAAQLAEVLPRAQHRCLPGQRHYVKADAIAPVLVEHFATAPTLTPTPTYSAIQGDQR